MNVLRRTLPIIAAPATVLMVLMPTGAAHAQLQGSVAGVSYHRTTGTIADAGIAQYSSKELRASCARGTHAVSAGAGLADGGGARALGMMDVDGGDGVVSGWHLGGGAVKLTAQVICIEGVAPPTVFEQTTQSASPTWIEQGLLCPAGTVPVGGGVSGTGDIADWVLSSSFPIDTEGDADLVPDDGWTSRTYYRGSGPETLHTHVSCMDLPDPAYRSNRASLPAGSAVTVSRLCPAGRPVLGGGHVTDGAIKQVRVLTSRPFDGVDADSIPDDGWTTTMRNTSAADATVTVHAICR